MITPQQALARLLDNNELFHDEMSGLMRQIMSAQVAPEIKNEDTKWTVNTLH